MNIEVRQNEVVVVPEPRMAAVQTLYTLGLAPCVGLVLWCPKMCAMGHFHTWENTHECAVVVEHFAAVCRSERCRGQATILRAIGNSSNRAAWHSEHMVSNLQELLTSHGLGAEEVRPRPAGECVNVLCTVATGALTYDFTTPPAARVQRRVLGAHEDTPDWVARPTSSPNLVVGVLDEPAALEYLKGYVAGPLRMLMGPHL